MKPDEIKAVLDAHAKWLRGGGGVRADLYGADLYGANLHGADLGGANLHGADLGGADLGGANLGGADLGGANLHGADLGGANLGGANLGGADLRGADLRGADLYGADLGNDFPFHKFSIVPETGAFEAFKKVRGDVRIGHDVVLRLRIPGLAKRVGGLVGRKCRASAAWVLEAYGAQPGQTEFVSQHDPRFVYRIGHGVEVKDFDPNPQNECAPGIHFFLTRREAEGY